MTCNIGAFEALLVHFTFESQLHNVHEDVTR